MTQQFSFYEDLTVRENLDLVAGVYEMPNRRAGGRGHHASAWGSPTGASQLAGQLSGGWKQRLALAACMLHEPKLLLLDEPTAGVDAKARREFWDLIHDMAGEGLTVLVSTHYMDEAERCNRIVYLASGRIVVQGDARRGVAAFRPHHVRGDRAADIDAAARRLRAPAGRRGRRGVRPRAPCRRAPTAQRSSGRSRSRASGRRHSWREVEPRLEDVFIHMLSVEGRRAT